MELGEIRGGEAFDLLQLLNTGHNGTISTVHANSAVQGLSRFTTCVLQSGAEMPYSAIKANIADSLNLIVQIDRRPGERFVSEVLEIRGYAPGADRYSLHTHFRHRYDREESRGATNRQSNDLMKAVPRRKLEISLILQVPHKMRYVTHGDKV